MILPRLAKAFRPFWVNRREVGAAKGDDLAVAGTDGLYRDRVADHGARASAADLYARHAQHVFRICLYQLGNRSEAEDAVQTTFLHALRALQRGTLPRVEQAWLTAIAQNVCHTMQRASSRRRNIETDTDPELVPEDRDATEPLRAELLGLEAALARIPANQRRAFVLREWHGLRYREIADVMGMSKTAVEMLAFRARKSLSEALDERRKDAPGTRVRQAFDGLGILSALRVLSGGSTVQGIAGAGVAALALVPVGATHSSPQREREPLRSHPSTALVATIASPAVRRRASIGTVEPRARVQRRFDPVPPTAGSDPHPSATPRSSENPPASGSGNQTVTDLPPAPPPVSVPLTPQLPVPTPPSPPAVDLPPLPVTAPVSLPTPTLPTPTLPTP